MRADDPRNPEEPSSPESGADWTNISYQNWPSDFIPSENGEEEAWGADNFELSRQVIKDFQGDLEKSGYKRKAGMDWFFIHPKKARDEWEKFKKRHHL